MSKCEWKDGKFEACDEFKPFHDSVGYFCRGCKETITKPKPELETIIKKSGGTYAAMDKNIDYLFINCEELKKKEIPLDFSNRKFWKPISEIEITDEISKLRPMVVVDNSIMKLIAVQLNERGYKYHFLSNRSDDCSLATVSDLEGS